MAERMLKSHHSLHFQGTAKSSSTEFEIYSKSDFDITLSTSRSNEQNQEPSFNPGEYYKRYEHDEVPVKDSSNTGVVTKGSLTNSDLEKIETRIYSNISQELQTEDSSLGSVESNIKFFKTTVKNIFDNFHESMRDFEMYRKRFHEIIAKNTQSSVEDMEDFIKDMFEHILSSGTCTSVNSTVSAVAITNAPDMLVPAKTNSSLLAAYVNENYLTDSTLDDNSPKGKTAKIDELFQILTLSDPQVHPSLNKRHLLSEINIRKPSEKMTTSPAASADNLKKLAAKRMEVEIYSRQQNDTDPDREIPVKMSFAKKDIYLDEDFSSEENNEKSKSLLYKICSLICKKFRNK